MAAAASLPVSARVVVDNEGKVLVVAVYDELLVDILKHVRSDVAVGAIASYSPSLHTVSA